MRYEGQCRLLKYECLDCHKAFIVGKELIRENKVACPYCSSRYTECVAGPPDDNDALYDELGCMSISNINGKYEVV